MMRTKNLTYLILAVLTVVGFFLRLHIGQGVSMHTDEGQFAYVTHLTSIFGIFNYIVEFSSRDQPMIMYLLVYFWKTLLGTSPEILRLHPATLTSLSIFFSGFFCLRTTQNQFLALGLALITTVCPFSIRYSYDVSTYCLVTLLAPISFFLFINHIAKKKYFPNFSLILLNIVLMNTHYYAFFSSTAQMLIFLFFILKEKQFSQLKNHILASAIQFVCAFIPLILLMQPKNAHTAQGWIERFGPPTLRETILKTIGIHEPFVNIYGYLLLCFGILFAVFCVRKKARQKTNLITSLSYYAVTIIVLLIVQHFTWPFLGHYRYLAVLFPVIFFMILICLDQIPSKPIKYIVLGGFVLLLTTDTFKNQPHINQDFSGTFAYLHEKEKDTPFVLFSLPPSYNKPLSLYYNNFYHLKSTIILDNTILDPANTQAIPNLFDQMKKNNIEKAYFITYYLYEMSSLKGQYLQRMNEIFDVTQDRGFRDIELYEMRPKILVSHAK